MTATTSVVLGLGLTFFGMLYLGFKLNDSDQTIFSYMGLMFTALSVALLQMIAWTTLQIAENNAMTYISNGLTTPLLWIVGLAMFGFWFSLLAKSIYGLAKILLFKVRGWFYSDSEAQN